MRFTKMHGIGNDYVYVNCFREKVTEPSALAVKISDRHFGAGSDGLVLIEPCEGYDFRMRMFNSDGSESEMCGNASRCVARYARERGLTDKDELTMLTGAGPIGLKLNMEDGRVKSVRVDMGVPELQPEKIPTTFPGERAMDVPLTVLGREYRAHCVSMGNPHCVVFEDSPEALDLPVIGPAFEHHPAFPRRTNTEFIRVENEHEITMRVWERGAGETWACGTGACASVVACILTGRCVSPVTVHLRGGDLLVHWDGEGKSVYQEGPAAFVYDGEWIGE